jgi:cobalt/nickel transport system permease protein
MGLMALETYVQGRSPIHCWAPRQKVLSLGALMFAFARVQQLGLILPMVMVTAALYGLSALPLGFLRQRLNYPGLFILAVVSLLPFTSGETILVDGGLIQLRQEGLITMAVMVGRFLSILSLGFILFGTTPFATLVQSLRRLGLPPVMADMTLLAYRYLYNIGGMLTTMRQAMHLRGFGTGAKQHWSARWRSLPPLALLIGNLLLRSYEQSERVYKAMVLRGYSQDSASANRTMAWTETNDSLGLTVGVLAIAVGFVMVEVVL